MGKYLELCLRKPLDKTSRNKLKAECPCPLAPRKICLTPECDAKMVAFLNRSSKDPRKGLESVLKGVQDKLLDIGGPATRNFEMAEETHLL